MTVHMESPAATNIWDFATPRNLDRLDHQALYRKAFSVARGQAEPRLRRAIAQITGDDTPRGYVDMQTIPCAGDVRLDVFVNLHLDSNVIVRNRVSVSSHPDGETFVEAPWFVATCRNCGFDHQVASATKESLGRLRLALDHCECGCAVDVLVAA